MEFPRRIFDGISVKTVGRWASLIGGGALLFFGVRRALDADKDHPLLDWAGVTAAGIVGGDLLYTGIRGAGHLYNLAGIGRTKQDGGAHTSVAYRQSIRVDEAVTVNRPVGELYLFWRKLENLPRIMQHLESVTELDSKRSRWVAKGPAGTEVTWEAEVINEIPNELIGWRSVNKSDIDNAGSVHFTQIPGHHGTIVHVVLRYDPPAGAMGKLLAQLFGEEPSTQVKEDLRRFKALVEAGEVPTTEGQPAGRVQFREEHSKLKRRRHNRKIA